MPRLIRSAFVIGRRDFTATVFSRAFLFFLLGPLFPVLLTVLFGSIGGNIVSQAERPVVAVVASDADYEALADARTRLQQAMGAVPLVEIRHERPQPDAIAQRERLLRAQSPPVVAVLDGGLATPALTGGLAAGGGTVRQLQLLIDQARLAAAAKARSDVAAAPLRVAPMRTSAGSLAPARALTARAGQALLFLLTLLLGTMLLSQMIDEKSNKIIEVLAAAVPIEAIFLGKLFAMLCISLLGITVWGLVGAGAIAAVASQGLGTLPPPAVGWPVLLALGLVYFAMSYLLLGAVFLGIGAQASTAREVQTLSMPVTMLQVLIFALASTSIGNSGTPQAMFAAAFPLSSPFVMLARAAEQPAIWPHLVAIAWQAVWVVVILWFGARLFRRSVLKSGPSRRPWWRAAKSGSAQNAAAR